MFKERIQMRAKLVRMFMVVSLLTMGLLLATPTPTFACHITVNWDADCDGFSGSVTNSMDHSVKFEWKVKLYQGDTLVEQHSGESGRIYDDHTYDFPPVTWDHTPMCGPFRVKAWVKVYRWRDGDFEEREDETWDLDCPCTSLEMDKTSVVSDNPLVPGSTITYNIVVSNPTASSGSNTNIVISDPLPTGTSYVSGSSQVTAPATLTQSTVRDEFNARSYSNNDGTVNWAGDWQEIGETQGAGALAGEVQVRDGKLRIGDQDYKGGDPGAWRTADLSDATSATFSFDYQAVTNESYDWLAVQVSSNGGGSWDTLKTFKGSSSGSKSYDISSYASSNTAVRFVVTNRYGGDNDFFYADNVQIEFSKSENVTAAGGAPPDLVTAAAGYDLLPGESMSVTFQVTVNDPIPDGLTEIENTACVTSDQVPDPLCDTTTDPVEPGGPPAKGSIGDYVWHDLFHSQTHQVDGIQDDGESGLEGVLVELYQGGGKVGEYTTGANGYYEFTDLDAGAYTVKIAASNFASGGVLEGWYASPPNEGGDDAKDSDGDETNHEATVTLAQGEDNDTIDFGFFYSSSITIVKQTDPDGGSGFSFSGDLGGFTLNDDGSKSFDDLAASDYDVTESVPADWELDSVVCSGGTSDPIANGVTVHLGVNEHVTCTFNNIEQAGPASICLPSIDFDTDEMGSSLGEGTIVAEQWAARGVHITTSNPTNHPAMIFDSSDPTGGDSDLGTPNEDFCADGSGLYDPSTCTAGRGPGIGNGGEAGTSGENSLALGKILIISEDNNPSDPDDNWRGGTITFTLDEPTRVEEVHILDIEESGGKVRAWNAETGGTLLREVNMQAYGNNSFQIVTVNAVGVRRLEIIFGGSGGVSAVVFCSEEEGSLGDYVWEDFGENSVQGDLFDIGINGVVVELWKGGVQQDTFTTINDPDTGNPGYYLFENLTAGTYTVKVADSNFDESGDPLYGYTFVTQNAGTDDTLDSDFDPATKSASVTLGAGEHNRTIDAGLKAGGTPTAVTLSSFAAKSSAGGVASPLWLGLAGLTVVSAGSLFWTKRRVGW